MNVRQLRLSRNSVLLLVIQLGLASSVAAKYLYERWAYPRAWAQVVGFDPESPLRGRYLSLQLLVDGCGSTLPNARSAQFPRNVDGTVRSPHYTVAAQGAVAFPGELAVQKDRLVALKLPDSARPAEGVSIFAPPDTGCEAMRLTQPVNFYLPEHAANPLPLKQGTELWMQVTVPQKGLPRPIALAIKEGGVLRTLALD